MEIIIKAIFAIISVILTAYVIPYLKSKGIYDKIKMIAQGLEKLADTQQIAKDDKNKLFWELAVKLNIPQNEKTEMMLEAALVEIDALKNNIL